MPFIGQNGRVLSPNANSGVLDVSFAPTELGSFLLIFPRLARWAAFFRRFAAGIGLVVAAIVTSSTNLETRATQRSGRSNDHWGGSACAFRSRGHPWRTCAARPISWRPPTSHTRQYFAA